MLKKLLRRLRRLMLADVLAELEQSKAKLEQIKVKLEEKDKLAERIEAALLTIALNRDTVIANPCECGGKQSVSVP